MSNVPVTRQKMLRRSYSIRCKVCTGFGASDPYPDWPGYCRRCADELKQKQSTQCPPIIKLLFSSSTCLPGIPILNLLHKFLIHKQNDKLVVWNLESGDCVHLFGAHTADISSFVILKNDTSPRVLSTSPKETLLWELADGKILKNFRAVPSSITPDPNYSDRMALTFFKSPIIEIWDFEKRVTPSITTLRCGTDPVTCLSYLQKGQKLVAAYTDKTVRHWHISGTEPEILLKEESEILSLQSLQEHMMVITPHACQIWTLSPSSGKTTGKIHSHKFSTPVTKMVPFVKINVTTLKEGFGFDKNVLKLYKGLDVHFPDTFVLSSVEMSYRVSELEHVIIGVFNYGHVGFVLNGNK